MRPQFIQAKQEFQRARQRARIQEIAAQFTGKSVDLLVYEEVRQRLKAVESSTTERKNIPVEAIIGSVGRYSDFNREFLPLRDQDRERWANVKLIMEDMRGLPPIDVYQIGDAYFVMDGNHRVSIARQLGATVIEAYVRTVHTRVPLPANASEEDLIILSEFAHFLDLTHLDDLRPDAHLRLTAAGQYDFLLQQIEVQHFLLELHQGQELTFPQAASQWYDDIYLPIVEMIRARALLQDFPTRTETDFFVWLLNHQAQLTKETGWNIRLDAALSDLTEKTQKPGPLAARLRNTVLHLLPLLTPAEPAPGQWRETHQARPGRLFGEILVHLTEPFPGPALATALGLAQTEQAQVYALYTSRQKPAPDKQAHLKTYFHTLCERANIPGQIIFARGKTDTLLPARSRWVDLVILPLPRAEPAPAGTVPHPWRALLQHCPTPILFLPPSDLPVPDFTPPTRALLAYDGSPKADEALYLAAYLALFWEIELVIFSVTPTEAGRPAPPDPDFAITYLRRYHLTAPFLQARGETAPEILRAAQTHACDLILMGGYSQPPRRGGFRPRTVDTVLEETPVPVLICR